MVPAAGGGAVVAAEAGLAEPLPSGAEGAELVAEMVLTGAESPAEWMASPTGVEKIGVETPVGEVAVAAASPPLAAAGAAGGAASVVRGGVAAGGACPPGVGVVTGAV